MEAVQDISFRTYVMPTSWRRCQECGTVSDKMEKTPVQNRDNGRLNFQICPAVPDRRHFSRSNLPKLMVNRPSYLQTKQKIQKLAKGETCCQLLVYLEKDEASIRNIPDTASCLN